jgi:hypothetical protein
LQHNRNQNTKPYTEKKMKYEQGNEGGEGSAAPRGDDKCMEREAVKMLHRCFREKERVSGVVGEREGEGRTSRKERRLLAGGRGER